MDGYSIKVKSLKMAYSAGVHLIAIGEPFQKQAYRTIILYIQTDPIMLTPATWGLLVWYSLLLAYLG
jgi:hypothetical protein